MLLGRWRFSLLLLSLLDNRLDFSREEIRFFLSFHSISVVCLHELADCGACDNLSFPMLLYLLFLNKLYLHTELPQLLLVTAETMKRKLSVYTEPGAHAGLTCAASARAGLGVCWWRQGVALALGWGWQSLQVWVSMLFSFLWLWEARAALVH